MPRTTLIALFYIGRPNRSFNIQTPAFFAFGGALLKTGLWVQCRFPVRALSQSGVFGFLFL